VYLVSFLSHPGIMSFLIDMEPALLYKHRTVSSTPKAGVTTTAQPFPFPFALSSSILITSAFASFGNSTTSSEETKLSNVSAPVKTTHCSLFDLHLLNPTKTRGPENGVDLPSTANDVKRGTTREKKPMSKVDLLLSFKY